MESFLVKLTGWLIVMVGVTSIMTAVITFVDLEFGTPFDTELGRSIWSFFAIWAGVRVAKLEI